MVGGIMESGMVLGLPFEYVSPVHVTIEESSQGVAIIRGTLLAEGESKNGNLYTVEEMAQIAPQAEGKPIYVGTMLKCDPKTRLCSKNAHANIKENLVGRIIKAVFDPIKRVINFWARIVNTEKYPKLIEEVKSGWGISIGGVAMNAKRIITNLGRVLTKILGLKLQHIQLLSPKTIRGQDVAKVEGVNIQETMNLYMDLYKPEDRKPERPKRKIDITVKLV